MNPMKTLLEQENVVSLRTAYVFDDGNLVGFLLLAADFEALVAEKDFEWTARNRVWLYRHLRSPSGEKELMGGFPLIEQGIKPMAFSKTPVFRLAWSDSGNSVALYVNDEPWAFIDEQTQAGFSKGILKPRKPSFSPVGKFWDQELFEKIFLS
jgi:hypothetical protein